jgi:hypothetical protein
MMQKSIDRFLRRVAGKELGTIDDKFLLIVGFWNAVKSLFPDEWEDPRHHLLTKGIGLYSLMLLLGDIVMHSPSPSLTEEEYARLLLPLKNDIDWHSKGMFADAGGQKGAVKVYERLKRTIGQ